MLTELSLNILDIANNSIRADATLITIQITVSTEKDCLTILIKDNGKGMDSLQLSQVDDPFFTTRTTRRIGLGIPFFKMAALLANGTFHIESSIGTGTSIMATFGLSHIDRMPLGDINTTIHSLITCNPNLDFDYTYTYNQNSFTLDTRVFRTILNNIPLNTKEVSDYIKDYLKENKIAVDGGISY